MVQVVEPHAASARGSATSRRTTLGHTHHLTVVQDTQRHPANVQAREDPSEEGGVEMNAWRAVGLSPSHAVDAQQRGEVLRRLHLRRRPHATQIRQPDWIGHGGVRIRAKCQRGEDGRRLAACPVCCALLVDSKKGKSRTRATAPTNATTSCSVVPVSSKGVGRCRPPRTAVCSDGRMPDSTTSSNFGKP